jgi:hypothetical protein
MQVLDTNNYITQDGAIHHNSGKSVACVVELFRQALAQPRALDPQTAYYCEKDKCWKGERTGKRKVRTAVVRNTTPQLEMTTMKTWLEWLPEDQFGKVRWRAPYRHDIRIPELDLEWEVWFLALDRDEDVKKLLSFELTNIWFNEARELSRGIITAGISRLKRFPRAMDGGSHRFFAIMDTNAPDEEHWWSIMSGQVDAPDWMSEEDRLTLLKPQNWEFFIQPPAVFDVWSGAELTGYELNPNRDNARFTDESYYVDLREGQTRDWIRNMLQNQIGHIFAGRPVYQGFSEKYHVATLDPDPAEPIYIGVDFGLTPAAAFGQDVRGQVRALDELVTRDTHTEDFAILLAQKIQRDYEGYRIVMVGDPRGDDRQPNQEDAKATAFRIFKKHGLDIEPAWSNDPIVRIGAVQTQLNTMVDGRPGYVIDERCTYLLNAKKGGYCYLKDGDTIDKKSIYSHVSDGEQYMMLKMGYGKKLIGSGQSKQTHVQANHKQSLFNRGGKTARARHREASILSRGRG